MEQNTPTPSSQKLFAALAAAQPAAAMAIAANGGHSVAEMAQRDLDAALQLLADRAQYITGASGAAIALRRDGRNDMLCRASSGSSAPELGALLSSEWGLSGESVRTRQLLRCDDAERDGRVNREVCRQMGIASVVVMPVVHDDQVLGVFELFSGKAHAFGERDLSAVQRLSEMVETAVRLAHAAEALPEPVNEQPASASPTADTEILEGQFLTDLVIEEPDAAAVHGARAEKDVPKSVSEAPAELPKAEFAVPSAAMAAVPNAAPAASVSSQAAPPAVESAPKAAGAAQSAPMPDPEAAASSKKTLFWSAALDLNVEAAKSAEDDQAHVPPVLRGLQKCVACGFPVSAGRMLCVECEEKKWRGQLRSSQVAAKAAASKPSSPVRIPRPVEPAMPAAQAFAAAAPSMAKAAAVAPASVPIVPSTVPEAKPAAVSSTPATPPTDESKKESKQAAAAASIPASSEAAAAPRSMEAAPDFVLSAGLESSQSWLSRSKYVLAVLVAIAGAAVAAIYFLR